jgi:hypothetical protein
MPVFCYIFCPRWWRCSKKNSLETTVATVSSPIFASASAAASCKQHMQPMLPLPKRSTFSDLRLFMRNAKLTCEKCRCHFGVNSGVVCGQNHIKCAVSRIFRCVSQWRPFGKRDASAVAAETETAAAAGAAATAVHA